MKTNFNLNLKSTTPLQALEAKAAKASAIAMAKARNAKDTVRPKTAKGKPKRLSPIETSLRQLQRAVEGWRLDGRKATFERAKGGTSACAAINIYNSADAAVISRRYVFYPHPLDASRLGSVAIYGADAKETLESITRSGFIFGCRIRQATLEFGRRPFVDVKFSKF